MLNIQRRNKTEASSKLEFTPDFIRDITNKFDDIETVSNLSKVSKNFNKSINFSDEKNRKHLLKSKEHKFNRHIYLYPESDTEGQTDEREEIVTAYYSEYSNGKREGSYKEIAEIYDSEEQEEEYEANLVESVSGNRDSHYRVYEKISRGNTQYRIYEKMSNGGRKTNYEGEIPEKINRECTYVKGKIEGILYDRTNESLSLEYLYSNNVLKSITCLNENKEKIFYAELRPLAITPKEVKKIIRRATPSDFNKRISTQNENDSSQVKVLYAPPIELNMEQEMSQNFVPIRDYMDFMNNAVMECTLFESFGKLDESRTYKEIFENGKRSRVTLFGDHKIVEKAEGVQYSKRIYHENKEIFSFTRNNTKISGKSASIKFSGTIDNAKEEYYENGEKVGEINYDSYEGPCMSNDNKISRKNKSYYKNLIVNRVVHGDLDVPQYFQAIYVTQKNPFETNLIVLKEQF